MEYHVYILSLAHDDTYSYSGVTFDVHGVYETEEAAEKVGIEETKSRKYPNGNPDEYSIEKYVVQK